MGDDIRGSLALQKHSALTEIKYTVHMSHTPVDPQELRSHHLFSSLSDAQLEQVIHSTRIIHLQDGEHLFESQQQAHYFFMVRSGRVRLFLVSPNGGEKIVHLIGPGESFGEAIMFMDSQVYPLYSAAIGSTELIAFSNKVFREVLQESVDTCIKLLGDMSVWLRKQLMEIDALTLQNATLRLVNCLLHGVPHDSHAPVRLDLEAPKHVIASRLSIQPESFSRILRSLQQAGLIHVEGTVIEIPDPAALRAHCE